MPNGPDSNVLDSVASSIGDGALIEWEQVAQQVAGGDDAVLDELRLLEKIAKFHQDAQEKPSNQTTVVVGEERRADDPRTWAHFLILGRIGGGSFGDVYRAHDTKLQCDIALKLMRHDDGPSNAARVLKEARLLARVRHTNVVTVYGADRVDGRVGLWMELVRGNTLEDLLRRQGMFGAHDAATIGLDLCRAVAAVHRVGLLHGDINARNVMREEGGRTVLMDAGGGADLDRYPRRTKVADVHSLGVLLSRLVTDRRPGSATQLGDLRPDLPDEFVTVIARSLDPDPTQRFQSADAFEAALAKFLGAPVENVAATRRRLSLSRVWRAIARRRSAPRS